MFLQIVRRASSGNSAASYLLLPTFDLLLSSSNALHHLHHPPHKRYILLLHNHRFGLGVQRNQMDELLVSGSCRKSNACPERFLEEFLLAVRTP
jgi:hypothetical protein